MARPKTVPIDMPENATPSIKAALYLQFYKKSVLDYYGWKCNCCGETTPQFLTVDHVDNDGFLDKDSNGRRRTGYSLYYKIVKEGFGSKYQILCMNCNHGKRMTNDVCPHKLI